MRAPERIPDASRDRLKEALSDQASWGANKSCVYPERKRSCHNGGKAPRDDTFNVGTIYGHRLAWGAMNFTVLAGTITMIRVAAIVVLGGGDMAMIVAVRFLNRLQVVEDYSGFGMEACIICTRKHARLERRQNQERKREKRAKRAPTIGQDSSKINHRAPWARVRSDCQ
ncbi:hypothetical protein QEZ47_27315 [Aminobacter anthyllidis]|uniref:hypothetical protein n=1 Tax=Aminobacter anthyllidis TaxID=1035067 RepID=UPI0024583FB3|nr:hypothetical protein [Aminobacter anthyllidis]MDH4989150.1 hypothetical protein [Aminobacter anthyllidis]